MPVEPNVTGAKSKAKAAGKIARINEEVEVVSPSASVDSSATAAMTDGSKRRYEAMEKALDRAYEDDEFSIVSETEFSPPSFPSYQAGLPDTFSWGPNWNDNEVLLNYDYVDDAVPKPAWIHSSEQWGRTLITMRVGVPGVLCQSVFKKAGGPSASAEAELYSLVENAKELIAVALLLETILERRTKHTAEADGIVFPDLRNDAQAAISKHKCKDCCGGSVIWLELSRIWKMSVFRFEGLRPLCESFGTPLGVLLFVVFGLHTLSLRAVQERSTVAMLVQEIEAIGHQVLGHPRGPLLQ
eukprot:s899_g25.t1